MKNNPGSPKEPWLAVFLSSLIPGLGHLYNGRIFSAFTYLAVWLFIVAFLRGSWLFVGGAVLVLVAMINAYKGAMKANGLEGTFLREMRPAGTILIAVCLVFTFLPYRLLSTRFLYHVYRIPGGAMKPSLLPHDWIMIDKLLHIYI